MGAENCYDLQLPGKFFSYYYHLYLSNYVYIHLYKYAIINSYILLTKWWSKSTMYMKLKSHPSLCLVCLHFGVRLISQLCVQGSTSDLLKVIAMSLAWWSLFFKSF